MHDSDADVIAKLIEWHTPEMHPSSRRDRDDRLANQVSADVTVDGLEQSIAVLEQSIA